ncbi:MAG: hypothetical protein ACFFF4_06830 [Candidatus Thorarchaeota archaeon]
MERGERSKRKGSDEGSEGDENDEFQRELDDFVKNWEKERREKTDREADDQNRDATTDEGEPRKELENAVKEMERKEEEEREERERKQAEAQAAAEEARKANPESTSDKGSPEGAISNAVKELEREEEKKREQEEQREAERETARKEREETADKDVYEEGSLEKWMIDTLEKHGDGTEDVEKRWHDRIVDDIKEFEKEDEEKEKIDGEKDEQEKTKGESKREEGYSTYDDGSGQMYSVKHEGSEHAEGQQETQGEGEVQQEMQEPPSESPQQETEKEETSKSSKEGHRYPEEESETKESEPENNREQTHEYQEKNLDESTEQESPESSEKTNQTKEEQDNQEKTSTRSENREKTSDDTKEKRDDSEKDESAEDESSKKYHEYHEPSSMFPNGTPSLDTMIPESHEEKAKRWEAYVNDKWDELSEEEREELKKRIRSELQDEKDLEELLKRHDLENLIEDEAVADEITGYLEFRKRLQEEIESGSDIDSAIEKVAEELGLDLDYASEWAQYENLPEELHDLLARETQWRWHQLMRSIAEMTYPSSIDEFDEPLEFEEERVVKAWLEIRGMLERGEIEFIIKDGKELYNLKQVEELSFEWNLSEGQILAWLRGKDLPSPVRTRVLRRLGTLEKVLGQSQEDGINLEMLRHLYYNEGLSMKKTGERMGVSTKRIQKAFKKYNLTPRPAGPPKIAIDVDELRRLYEVEKWTISEIAREWKVDPGRVSQKVKEIGLVIENRIGATRRSNQYTINLWIPKIGDEEIRSIDELLDHIKDFVPGLFSHKNFLEMKKQAESHLELVKRLRDKQYINQGEIPLFAKEFDIPTETMRWMVRKAGRPRIYYFLDEVSIDDRSTILDEYVRLMNGVISLEEMDRRLGMLYYYDEILKSSSHQQFYRYSERYFEFWKEFAKGDTMQSISEKLGINRHMLTQWIQFNQIPSYTRLAAQIPPEEPEEGWKWIPLKLNILTNLPESFIQVPEVMASKDDLLRVLGQVTPLDIPEMKELAKSFAGSPLEIEFMYLLGLITSDGGFSHNIEQSANVQFTVGRKYPWGLGLGQAFCYAMGLLGFSTGRWKDDVRTRRGKKQTCMVWGSETSPFFAWMEKALLGLDTSMAKSRDPINADWILRMPHEWRVAFIQGLADGDGWASIKGFTTGIATEPNQEFVRDLFKTFGINSIFSDRSVSVGKHSEIQKAQQIPLFRNASGRQKRLNTLSEIIAMLKSRKTEGKELEIILDLAKKGKTPGETTEILWYRYKIARTPSSIYYILEKYRETKDS